MNRLTFSRHVRSIVGTAVGTSDGANVGRAVGSSVGAAEGSRLGAAEGSRLGVAVGAAVAVGIAVGTGAARKKYVYGVFVVSTEVGQRNEGPVQLPP